MTDRPGPKERALAWLKERAPPVHHFLTTDKPPYSSARTILGVAGFVLIVFALLWGGTGQSLGDAPVVVVETGSMMHCEEGVGTTPPFNCGSTSFGRLGAIDPGDLIFVKNADVKDDVATFVQDGKARHGHPGDAIVYQTPNGAIPIIHRAMFWIEVHNDGTFSIPELGLTRESDYNHPSIQDRERFGIEGFCELNLGSNQRSGWITKGDNNRCWDQTGDHSISPGPVQPDWVLGKARGEVPWVGLLKLFVFDLFNGGDNYEKAPGDLKAFMWITIAAVIVVPYGSEKAWEAYQRRREGDAE